MRVEIMVVMGSVYSSIETIMQISYTHYVYRITGGNTSFEVIKGKREKRKSREA